MPLFKKKNETEAKGEDDKPRRSKFVEAPRVFMSVERSIPLAPYQNYKISGGVTIGVGDTMTIMKQGAVTIQENETVAEAFARGFQATNDAIDAEARSKGLKEIMDRNFAILKSDAMKEATPAKQSAAPGVATKPAPKPAAKPAPKPTVEEIKE